MKNRLALITPSFKEEIHKYAAGFFRNKGNKLLAVNAMPDHIHIFFSYKLTVLVPDLVKDFKKASNELINTKFYKRNLFAWQNGYGVFSYSESQIDQVVKYINNQEKHHMRESFREEYIKFLKKFNVNYKEEHLFNWIVVEK